MTIQLLVVPIAVSKTAYVLKLTLHTAQAMLSLPYMAIWIHPHVRTWRRRDRRSTYKIERKVLVLPLSREIGRIEQLRKSLVAYRSVIGQPKQLELLEFLSSRLGDEENVIQNFVESISIDLSPPTS